MNDSQSMFRIFCNASEFAAAFDEIRSTLRERRGEVLRDAMDHPTRARLILKTKIAGVPVVIKHEFFIFRFDRSVKAFLFGSDARNIFLLSERARADGFRGIPRTFLVAERFSRGILRETISVTEFLDGASPSSPCSRETQDAIAALMRECHARGIISGDVCPDNFLLARDGMKLIDFRGGKVFPCLAKARDRLQLERVFGIPNRSRGLPERIFVALHALRNLGRRLRGRTPIAD